MGLLLAFTLSLCSSHASFAQEPATQASLFYGPIKQGETLWKIARQIRPDVNLSYYQVMLALLKANPSSFQIACNLNTLKVGSTLIIPTVEDMRLNNHAQANQAFSKQVEDWEMFNKHGVAIECEDNYTNTAKITAETTKALPPQNDNKQTLNHSDATANAATNTETTAKPPLTAQPTAAPHATQATESPASTPTSTVETQAATPLTPLTGSAISEQPAASDTVAKPSASPTATPQPSDSILTQAFAQLLSTTFWQNLLQGKADKSDVGILLLLMASILFIVLMSFWVYKRSCRILLKQTFNTQAKEQETLKNATLNTDGELSIALAEAEELKGADDSVQPDSVIAERPFGWLLAVVVPLFLYFGMQNQPGLNENAIMFTAIVSVPLIMWMFSLLPDFVPALFAVLLCLLFGLAPAEIVLSGFSSSGFLLTFSVLGLGVVIISSGLTYRYTLLMLTWLPQHTLWYQLALFFTGVLFTPVVPSIAGRAAITAPILRNMTKNLDANTKQRAAGMLYSSGLDGISFVSAIFLTSAPANLIIFGMLPQQEQQAFQFMYWLYAASLTGGIMLLLYLLISALYFHAYQAVQVSKQHIQQELQQMGSMSWREWWALAGIIVLAIGIVTASIHKIKIPFVAFTVFFVLLFLGVLTRDEFIKKIDWAFLFLLGCLIGVVATMNYLEIDKLLLLKLSVLGDYMRHDFHTFIFILSIAILGVRFFIPINSTILIFSTAFLPLANASGVSPWLVGFIILVMAETSIFNYQSPHILYFSRVGQGDLQFNEWSMTFFKVLLVIAKLIAIYASIPFWLSIGVL